MNVFKNLLSSFDIFGITYSFRYKDKEKYQTVTGGIIMLLFLILVLAFGIYYFIPFINRNNYTIVYYTMNLAVTEEVNLFNSESNIAVGLNCEYVNGENLSIFDLFYLKSKYILYIKNQNGTFNKVQTSLKTHKCTYEDFYNKYNKQVDYLGLTNYECLDIKNNTLQGIFADQIFSYYEFTASAKSNSSLKQIDRFLFENDCKFNFAFTDIIIDLDNYKEPITQFINDIFIQLNPTLFIKRNVYFMNQYFSNDDYVLFVFKEDEIGKINIF